MSSIEMLAWGAMLPLWLFSIYQSYQVGRLEQQTSYQTRLILELQNDLMTVRTRLIASHGEKLDGLEERLSDTEYTLRNLRDD